MSTSPRSELRLECLKVAAMLTDTPDAAMEAARKMELFVTNGQVPGSITLSWEQVEQARREQPQQEPAPSAA